MTKYNCCEVCDCKLESLDLYEGKHVICPSCGALLRVYSRKQYFALKSSSRYSWDEPVKLKRG